MNALNEKNVRMYILAQVPENKHTYPRELALQQWRHGNIEGIGPSRAEHIATSQYDLFENLSGDFIILDPTTIFYPGNSENQLTSINNEPLYHDKDHLNSLGSNLLLPVYEQIIF